MLAKRENKIRFWATLSVLLLLLLTSLYAAVYAILIDDDNSDSGSQTSENHNSRSTKIVVAVVSCREKDDWNRNEEASVLIKSILISAWLHEVTEVEFHLFLEHQQDRLFFKEKLAEYLSSNIIEVDFRLLFHDAMSMIPDVFAGNTLYTHRFRCGFNRFFVSRALPEVDSIIYFDVDSIVTGSIRRIWSAFAHMKPGQLIVAAARHDSSLFSKCLNGISTGSVNK